MGKHRRLMLREVKLPGLDRWDVFERRWWGWRRIGGNLTFEDACTLKRMRP